MDEQKVQQMIDASIENYAHNVQFQVAPIPAHTHNGVDSNQVDGSNIISGSTYTPTLTGVTNVTSSTPRKCIFLVLGSLVTVSGELTVKPTAGVATELGISLPTPSRFTGASQCGGVACSFLENQAGEIRADITNLRATLLFAAVSAFSKDFSFTFTYQIV